MAAAKKAKKQSRSAKAPLSREKVLRKALRLADSAGVEQLSMRKLAESLGVEAMSLYNHVQNKDDVLDGMLALVVAEFLVPANDQPWKQALRESALSTHAVLMKHPWAAQLLISRIMTSEAMMKYSDASLGCLRRAGFSYAMSDHAWNAVTNHIYGFSLTQLNSPIDEKDWAKAAKAFLPQVPADAYPHVHGMMELVISGEHSGINNVEFGLDLILDGLERMQTDK